jgi:YD repeat-containing protein
VMTPGVWRYRYEGDGALIAVADAAFNVTSTPFTDFQP